MTNTEKRKALAVFCHKRKCKEFQSESLVPDICTLYNVCECGKGQFFTSPKREKTAYMPNTEIDVAYAIAFLGGKEAAT